MTRYIKYAIVAAALGAFAFSPTAMAQRGGHGHGGHGHGGHGHGAHFSHGGHGAHGGHGFHYGGHHHHGGHYHGGHHHGGHYHSGIGFYFGPRFGYGPYYGYYGGYYDNYYYAPRRVYVQRPIVVEPANVAYVEVRLPDPEGEYWVQGEKRGGGGTLRRFRSPPLEPGRDFVYTVTAAWHENGRLVTQERRVTVHANASFVVDFTQPDPNAIQPAPEDVPPPAP